MALKTAAIEDDGETKTATNGAYSGKNITHCVVQCWSGHPNNVWNSSPLIKVNSEVVHHINASYTMLTSTHTV